MTYYLNVQSVIVSATDLHMNHVPSRVSVYGLIYGFIYNYLLNVANARLSLCLRDLATWPATLNLTLYATTGSAPVTFSGASSLEYEVN